MQEEPRETAMQPSIKDGISKNGSTSATVDAATGIPQPQRDATIGSTLTPSTTTPPPLAQHLLIEALKDNLVSSYQKLLSLMEQLSKDHGNVADEQHAKLTSAILRTKITELMSESSDLDYRISVLHQDQSTSFMARILPGYSVYDP